MSIRAIGGLLSACAVAIACTANAQTYPTRPVTLVVPYGPGGNADLAARALAATAQKYLGQPIVVINKAGAGGMVGSRSVVDAPRDGYTLLLARVGSQAVAPALDPAVTYRWDSFSFLGLLETDPYVCVVSAKSPLLSFTDLVQAMKANPGKLSYASTGNFDASVVFPIKILLNAGLPVDAALKVPYKGAPDTVTAVMGDQTDFACNGISPYTGNLRAGNLRGLVVSTRDRVPEAPEVPTAMEVGMPDLEVVSGWSALYGPPELPPEVVEHWAGVLQKLKNDPAWTTLPRQRGSIPTVLTPDETRKFAERQYRAYESLRPELLPR